MSNRKTLLLSLILGGVLAAPAWSADLMDTWRAARDYDATYAAARAARDAGLEKLPQGRAALLPQINGQASSTRQYLDKPQGVPNYRNTNVQVGLSQTLFDWSKFATYGIGEQLALIAEDQFQAAEQALIVRVAQAYFDVLLAQDTLAYTRSAKEAFAQALAQAKKTFEVGNSTIVDTYEAQANYDAAVAQEIAAQNDLTVKQNALRLLANVDPATLKPLATRLPLTPPQPADLQSWLVRSEAANLDVLVKRKQLEVAKKNIEVSRAGHLPSLDLNAGWARNDTSQLGQIDTRGKSIGLTLTVPLFAGGGVQSSVREKAALADQARADLDTARRGAEQNTRSAWLGVTSGAAQVVARENALKSFKGQLDSTRLGREVGVRTSLDVLNAEQQYAQAQKDLASAKYQYLIARLQLAQAANQLTPEKLEEINRLLAG